ncbi:MAG TPA: YiiX family permuted papain-like enzyme [Bacteroidia bacterium]|jgi:hypothetical protein|nr:YiiX family permuted papain-like enzyme [Bacteroidia bacterium]
MTNKRNRYIFYAMVLVMYLASRFLYHRSSSEQDVKITREQIEANLNLHDGDIIFQSSRSAQSQAIQLATHSKYSHCGLIFKLDSGSKNSYYVLEAVQPVKWTSLETWISHGEGGHYVVKRCMSDPPLPPSMLQELKTTGEQYLGKNYDLYFGWGDDRMYCSELVWKVYHQVTGLEIGRLQQLKDFDLSSPIVQKKLKERYGDKIPLNDTVISPASIFDSGLLEAVKTN